MERLSARSYQTCRDKNHQVPFDMLLRIRAKKATDDRDASQERRPILCFLHIFAHQPSQHDRLAIPNADTGCHLSGAENRLINNIWGENALRRVDQPSSHRIQKRRRWSKDWTSVVDETFKLDDLRNEIEIDRHPIWSNHWLDFQGYTSIPGFEMSRRRRCHRHR